MVLMCPVEIMTSLRESKLLSRKKILWTTAQLSCLKCLGIHAVFLLMFSQSTVFSHVKGRILSQPVGMLERGACGMGVSSSKGW